MGNMFVGILVIYILVLAAGHLIGLFTGITDDDDDDDHLGYA